MAHEKVLGFFQAVKSDPKLRESLKSVSAETFSSAAGEIARIASNAGHGFTAADYEAAVRQNLDQQWWRYSQMSSAQEKELGITAATQPFGAATASDAVISECVGQCMTRIYTPCGC